MADTIKVYGIDFTSAPSTRKPITCLECELCDDSLRPLKMHRWHTFEEFEQFLAGTTENQPWVAAMDLPFGLSLRFLQNMNWPTVWADYIDQEMQGQTRQEWKGLLDNYRRNRCPGDKEHLRETDRFARSLSPQKVYGVPVGLMFYEGAKRLRDAGVRIPGLRDDGCPERLVLEGYPGVAVRQLVGPVKYKSETRREQTEERRLGRQHILRALTGGRAEEIYGIQVLQDADVIEGANFIEDPTGDSLDALLCAVQAAWAWQQGEPHFGMRLCPSEGWIADPVWNRDR